MSELLAQARFLPSKLAPLMALCSCTVDVAGDPDPE